MSFNIELIIGLLGLVISAVLWAIAFNKQRNNSYAVWLNSFFQGSLSPTCNPLTNIASKLLNAVCAGLVQNSLRNCLHFSLFDFFGFPRTPKEARNNKKSPFRAGVNFLILVINANFKQFLTDLKSFLFPSGVGPRSVNPLSSSSTCKSNHPDTPFFLSGSVLRAGFLMGIFVLLSLKNIQAADISSTTTGGSWSAGATWVGGIVPSAGDNITIAAGATVTIDADPSVGSLTIYGTLQYEASTARTLTVAGIVTINSGGRFKSAPSASTSTITSHSLVVGGSIINNGILDFSAAAGAGGTTANASGAGITFTGTSNATFDFSSATLTNLRQTGGVVLNKGTSASSVLSFIPGGTFQVVSANAVGFLTIANGTFSIIGSTAFNNPVFSAASYTIPTTGGFWLGNANATVTAMDGTATNLGDLKITSGTFLVGNSAEHALKSGSGGQFKMAGGTLIVSGGLEIESGTASISGGTISLAPRATTSSEPTFSVSAQARFEMYGDPLITLAFPHSKNVPVNDIQILGGSGFKSIKGGRIQLGTEETPAGSTFLVNSGPELSNLTVFNECAIQVRNTSGADLQNTPIDSLPLIVFDRIAPELVSPAKITLTCGDQIPAVFPSLQEFTRAGGTASDNCTLLPTSFKLAGQLQSSANCPYTITRTYEIKDNSGNAGTAEHLIVVEGGATETPTEAVVEPEKEQVLRLKSAMATITSTAAGGNWNVGTSWVGGVVPGVGDDVVIVSGATVTVNAAAACDNITIDAGSTLNYSGTNTLTVNGNWTNNGTYTAGTKGIIEFAGANPATIGGTATTVFKQFIVNKGALANIVQVANNIQLNGDITFTSGTMQVNSGVTVNCTHNAGFTIEQPAGLRVLGTFSSGAFSIDNKGVFEVAGGTANLGTVAGNSLTIRSTGDFILSSGQVNIAGRFDLSGGDATISGGTMNINTVGNNSASPSFHLSLTSVFNMTGGNIVFQNPNGTGNLDLQIENSSGSKTFSGGNITFGTGAITTYRIESDVPFPSNIVAANNANLILKMMVSGNGAYNFPLFTSGGVSIPATINLTGNGGLATDASIQIETFGTDHPNNASATNYLNRYWTVTTSGITSPVYNVTATYANSDLPVTATESEIAMGSYDGSLPWVKYGNANTSANTLSATGITATSFTFAGITSDPPTVAASASPTNICLGASSNLTATPVGDAPFGYSWTSNPAGFTSNSATPSVTPGSTTIYTVTVTDGNGFTATDDLTVTVNPLPTISGAMNVCIGSSTQLTGSGTAAAVSPWLSASPAVATVNSTGLVTGVSAGTSMITFTDNNGCSITATVTVNPLPTISGTLNVCVGSTTNLTGSGTPDATTPWSSSNTGVATVGNTGVVTGVSAGTSIITYKNTNSCIVTATITVYSLPTISGTLNVCIGSTTPLTGSATPDATTPWTSATSSVASVNSIGVVTGVSAGTSIITYRNNNGCTSTVTVTVNPPPTAIITINPGNTICSGSTVTFTTAVSNAGANPTYQWQINGVNVSGATNSTFSSSTLANAQQVRVIVTADPAYCSSTAVSNIYTMTVNPPVIPTVAILESANPICAGTSVNFSSIVVNGGSAPTYQWQTSPDGTIWTNISGATSSSYSSSTLANGERIRVTIVSNATCASPSSANSNAITMTVNPNITPDVSISANPSTPICPGTSVTYTATPTNGGSNPSYQWKINGVNVGSNNPVFTTATLANNDVISVQMTSNAPCASPTLATSNNITITVNPGTPAIPGPITGTNPACPALTGQTYSVAAVPNATSYTWTLPSGWTGTSTTNTITVTTGAAGQNGNITVTASNSCGTSAARALAVTVNPGTPATPGAISGTTPVCPGVPGLTYSISAVPNATSYTWTVPTGWTISSGAGTNGITVTSGSAGQNGDITVTATNSCGTSAASTLPVIVNPGTPARPGTIAGTTPVCPAITGLTYSIAAVPDATSYTWTVPTGWSITAGAGTNAITVTSGSAGQNGNISVTATNSCGTSTAQSLAVTVNAGTPATPGAITGTANQCISSSGLIYSIAAVPNATHYTWTLPSGWTGTSTTNSISVSTTATAVSGNITVTAGNTCATSSASSFAVIVSPAAPVTPSAPTGDASVCTSATLLNYTTTAVANATSYTWTIPAGWTIVSGAGTNSISVNMGTAADGNYNISVSASNACGTSASSANLVVTVGDYAIADAGADQVICLSTTSINIVGVSSGAAQKDKGTWTRSGTGTFGKATDYSTTYTPSAADRTSGTVTLTWTTLDPSGPCGAASDQLILTLKPNPTASISGSTSICSNSSTAINFTATPNTTVTYKINGGTDITLAIGATGAATVNTGSLVTNTTYTLTNVAYTTAPSCSQTASGSAVITVNPAATVSAGPAQTICAGSTATMAGAYGGSATSAIWSSSGTGTFNNNSTTAVYTPSVADISAGSVVLTYATIDPVGPCGTVSSTMVLTINPIATVNAGSAQTICAGSTATMAGSIGGSATAANWSGGGGSFSPNNTALNAVYTPTAAEILAGSTTLTLTTDDPTGPCGPVSATVVLTINPLATVNAGTDQTVCATSPVTLAGTVGGGASTGTWSGGLGTYSPNATTLNAVYTPTAAEIADGIVVLTLTTNDPAGPCASVSDQVQITINAAATVNAGLDQTICQGSFIILSGTIGGAATSGTWSGGTGTFSPNNTALNATYTPGAAETGIVTLTLTTNDPAGTCSVATDQVVLTIDPKPIVTVSPDQMICSNATATVVGSFGGGATSASWSTSGFGTFDNNTSATAVYTPGNGDISNGIVTLTYTTNDPAGICGPASAALTLIVKKVIVITSQPVNTGACATYPADLIVTAVGDNLTYQWYRGVAPGGTPVVNSSNISGAQSATLHFNNATQVDAGSYYVVISSANACSSETSTTVTLNVDQEISVSTQIQSNSVCVGDPVTFSIVAEPGGSLTYQWRKNGVDIPGETTNTLNLGNVDMTDNGSYDVQIKGLAGYTCSDAQSATATLTVNTDATIALTSAPGTNAQNGCLNQAITDITYTIGGGATDAGVTGLPAGVTGVYNAGVFTISGTPTATGTFNYTINTTGNCVQTSASGTIVINPSPTIALGTLSNYCPGVTSFTLPYLSTTESPNTYSISAGTPALSGFVPVAGAALGASPINVSLPAGVVAGTYQFVVTVKNSSNCSSASQTFTVTFEDVTPPVKPTLPNVVEQCAVTLTAPTTTDNCSGTISGTTTTNFPYTTTGVTAIEWTFTDAAGNSTTATQVVTINDQTAPTWVSFPADVLDLECGVSLNTTPAATGSPTATDNCSAVAIGYTESITVGTCSSRYTIKRTWKATDASGNSVTKDQMIYVVDTTPPVISCTSFTNFDANVVPSSELNTGISATDNCSPSGAITFELISEEYFGLDASAGWCPTSLERVYVAMDACGNVSSPCTQTYTFIDNPNCQACIDDPNTTEDNVPFFPVIFTEPDQTWTSPNVVRNGICCFAEGPPPPRCISFNVYLDPDAVGLIFTIPTGAIPGGALYYHVDCGPPQKVGEVLCLSGGRFYTITFCEPGNNPNTYSIQSISGAATTEDITTRADANCIKNIEVTGLQAGTVSWTVKFPANSDHLLSYLSCTDCLTPVFTPDVNTPPSIIYEVCGQLAGTYVCNGLPIMDCAELTVTTLPPITISFDIDLDNICADEIPGIDATVTPGVYAYDYKWYNSLGNLIGSGATWTPTAEGNYSLVVTENESGISCNSSTYSFTITFDYLGPATLNVPAPLEIECNQSDAETLIATWLATATAADEDISSIPVSNDYSIFTHLCGGIRTVTFSATDNCGNTTTGTSQIRITDTTSPLIAGAAPGSSECSTLDPNLNPGYLAWLANRGGATASDNCDDPSALIWTDNRATQLWGGTPAASTISIGFTVTDACLNSSVTTATYTITDATPPTITCPNDIEETAALNNCSKILVTPSDPTIADNCSTPVLTWALTGVTSGTGTGTVTGQLFNVGVTTVTYTVTDAAGNTATCSFTVWIKDLNKPVFTAGCPANPVPVNAEPGVCDAQVNIPVPAVSDPCNEGYTLTNDFNGTANASGRYTVGTTTVTWTIADTSGNVTTCVQTVIVNDTQPPAFTVCPPNVEDLITNGGCDLVSGNITAPVISDNCPNPVLSYALVYPDGTPASGNGLVSGLAFPTGITTVTYTATDAGGLTATCTFTVWIKNLAAPQFAVTCRTGAEQYISVPAEAGVCQANVTVLSPVISNPCNEVYTITNDFNNTANASGTYQIGTTTVTWTITDASGNVTTCVQTVTVNDTQPPVFTVCPPNVEDLITNGGCDLVSGNITAPVISDNCPNPVLSYALVYPDGTPASGNGPVSGLAFPTGVTTVTYIATDAGGLTATCTFTVWIKNLAAPQFAVTCRTGAEQYISIPADAGVCQANVTVLSPVISNPCNEVYTITNDFNNTANASGTYQIGTTTVTWTITDASGNVWTCVQTVTVNDTQPPVFTVCPPNVEDLITNGGCDLVSGNITAPVISDNCPNPVLSYALVYPDGTPASGNGPVSGLAFPTGVTTVTYIATDAGGLTATCTFTVWIKNLAAPQFAVTCRTGAEQYISVPAEAGICQANVTVLSPVISNPCNEVYTITNDFNGTDNASGIYQTGTTTVTWTITDASGNINTCTQYVTVTDTQNPVFTLCPPNQEQQITNGGCDLANVTVPNPTFTDNCAIESLIWTMTGATTNTSSTTGINYVSGQTFNVGVTLVSYTVTDVNGLTATCTFTVWMKNLDAPKLTAACPSDVSVPADQYVCEAVVTVPAPAITNPCNEIYTVFNNSPYKTSDTDASGTYPIGTTTVTWTVTDASGNVTTCTQYVVVTDLLPTIDCPDDITEQADFELPYKDQVTVPHPTYDDNCPDPVLTWEMTGVTTGSSTNTTGESFVPSPSRFNVGVTFITYTVTDDHGNTVSCTFTVTILAKPEITCHIDISGNTDTGTCTYNVNPGVPTLDSGVQPITWDWTITAPDGTTQASGTFTGDVSNPGPPDIGAHDFKTGTSSITWRATNVSGYDECTQLVIVEDKEPPTFTSAPITECVDLLSSAVYTASNPNPNSGIEPNLIVKPSPDYYTFKAGDTSLDLTNLNDNCCGTASMTINWRIEFADVPDPLNSSATISHPDITGTGQPSEYVDPISGLPADILLWGDGVTYTPVTHSIFYWMEDCNGNATGEQREEITITPRPEIIKMN